MSAAKCRPKMELVSRNRTSLACIYQSQARFAISTVSRPSTLAVCIAFQIGSVSLDISRCLLGPTDAYSKYMVTCFSMLSACYCLDRLCVLKSLVTSAYDGGTINSTVSFRLL